MVFVYKKIKDWVCKSWILQSWKEAEFLKNKSKLCKGSIDWPAVQVVIRLTTQMWKYNKSRKKRGHKLPHHWLERKLTSPAFVGMESIPWIAVEIETVNKPVRKNDVCSSLPAKPCARCKTPPSTVPPPARRLCGRSTRRCAKAPTTPRDLGLGVDQLALWWSSCYRSSILITLNHRFDSWETLEILLFWN